MKVLVCGGRDFHDYGEVGRAMLEIHEATPISELIHGGAAGVDNMADRWAKAHGIRVHVYPADWDALGRRAGPIRNQRMLDEGKPDLVVAFPGGAGTADMVRRAVAAEVKVVKPELTKWRIQDG